MDRIETASQGLFVKKCIYYYSATVYKNTFHHFHYKYATLTH